MTNKFSARAPKSKKRINSYSLPLCDNLSRNIRVSRMLRGMQKFDWTVDDVGGGGGFLIC